MKKEEKEGGKKKKQDVTMKEQNIEKNRGAADENKYVARTKWL